MVIPPPKALRRTLAVVTIGLAVASFIWAMSLWAERQTARARFDRIKVGMLFRDVMRQMEQYHYSGRNRIRFDWNTIPANGMFVPLEFGSANAGFMVCFERQGPKDLQVFYKQYQEKPMGTILRERWQVAFGSAPSF